MLSKIECDKATPSLRTLHRIVSVLDTSIASLFADPAGANITLYRRDERPVVVIDSAENSESIRLERKTPYAEGQLLEGNVHVVSPGATNGGAIDHVGEEVGYVIEGEFELTVGSTTYHLKAGDSFFFRSELPHSYRNPGQAATRIIWVNSPPTFWHWFLLRSPGGWPEVNGDRSGSFRVSRRSPVRGRSAASCLGGAAGVGPGI